VLFKPRPILCRKTGWPKAKSDPHEREGITGYVILGVITSRSLNFLVVQSVYFRKGIVREYATGNGNGQIGADFFDLMPSNAFMPWGLFLCRPLFLPYWGNAHPCGVLISDASGVWDETRRSIKVRAMVMLVL